MADAATGCAPSNFQITEMKRNYKNQKNFILVQDKVVKISCLGHGFKFALRNKITFWKMGHSQKLQSVF